jgi:uncharacterized Zn finger protein
MGDKAELITEKDVRERYRANYVERGERYQRDGHIASLWSTDHGLVGLCHGSEPEPYRVEVAINQYAEIGGSLCSCPIGGDCKHVVALLLEFIRSSESASQTLGDTLEECSKAQLVDLLTTVTREHPSTLKTIESRLDRGEETALSPSAIQKKVEGTVDRATDYSSPYEASLGVSSKLEPFVESAQNAQENGEFRVALEWCRHISLQLMESFFTFDDSSGRLAGILYTISEQLTEMLEAVPDGKLKKEIAEVVWTMWNWQNESGGLGIGDPIYRFLSVGNDEEFYSYFVRQLGDRLETYRESDDPERREAQRAATLYLDMTEEEFDAEEFVTFCRDFGLYEKLIFHYIERDSHDKAKKAARNLRWIDIQRVASEVEQEDAELAYEIVSEAAESASNRQKEHLQQWLIDYHERHKEWSKALKIGRGLLERRQSAKLLDDLKRYAKEVDRWEELEDKLVAICYDEKPGELVRYYLKSEDNERAIEVWTEVRENKQGRFRKTTNRLDLELAEAVEETHPDTAVDVYLEKAQSLIDRRGRSKYQSACEHLSTVKNILLQHSRGGDWQKLRGKIIEQHDQLPAFKDEMKKAGLRESPEEAKRPRK